MKCEVLEKATLTINKGSIVEVDPLQFEVARRILKPIGAESTEDKPKREKRAKK